MREVELPYPVTSWNKSDNASLITEMSNIVIGASEKSSVILPTHATQCVEEVCPYSTKNFTTACRSCQLASIDNLIGRGLPFTLSVTKKDYRRLCKLKYLRWSTDFLIPRPVYHTDADFSIQVCCACAHDWAARCTGPSPSADHTPL